MDRQPLRHSTYKSANLAHKVLTKGQFQVSGALHWMEGAAELRAKCLNPKIEWALELVRSKFELPIFGEWTDFHRFPWIRRVRRPCQTHDHPDACVPLLTAIVVCSAFINRRTLLNSSLSPTVSIRLLAPVNAQRLRLTSTDFDWFSDWKFQ